MKSRASGYLPFMHALVADACEKSRASRIDVKRDLMTIESRLEHEGLSFLTITLPDFGEAFDQALSEEWLDLSRFPGWKSTKRLPAFLRGFVCRVFDINSGRLLDEPCIESIKAIRQITRCFKKILLPCTRKREQAAIQRYIKVERDLASLVPDDRLFTIFGEVADRLWGRMFDDFDHHSLLPKHGPGAVVEKYTHNQKYTSKRWHSRLEPYFPPDEYVYSNINHFIDEGDKLTEVPEDDESPVKVTLVPKTLKTPRIIAIEPCCMQYAQQALKAYIVDRLERARHTRRHINFRDQSINQALAMSASSQGHLATVDMKDASDRIHLLVVERMLRKAPELLGALLAARSKAAQLPSGDVISLEKFASMGSATCFPIEAMVFYTSIISIILENKDLPVTWRNIYKISRQVWVYGDDIVIPVDQAQAVTDSLSAFGCKVNPSKTFYKGRFRESCGVDAYGGIMVTPIYIRHPWPRNRGNASGIISLVAAANQFSDRGYYRTLLWLKSTVEELVGPLPQVASTCPGLGWSYPFNFPHSLRRFNRKYQVEQVLTWVPGPVYRVDKLCGWDALLKFLIKPSSTRSFGVSSPEGVDKKHLTRSPRHGASGLKRRWVTPY